MARLTPTAAAISRIGCWRARIASAAASFSALNDNGRPPSRPRARAAANPARVRSRMTSRSNSASAPKMWNCRRPAGGRGVDRFRQRSKADLARVKPIDRFDQVLQTSTQPVQAPHHQRVPRPQIVKAGIELRAMLQRARADVAKHPLAARRLKRVELQIEILLIGRHAGVTDHVAGPELATHRAIALRSLGRAPTETLGSATEFCDTPAARGTGAAIAPSQLSQKRAISRRRSRRRERTFPKPWSWLRRVRSCGLAFACSGASTQQPGRRCDPRQ